MSKLPPAEHYAGQFRTGNYQLTLEEVPLNYRLRAYAGGLSVNEMRTIVVCSRLVATNAIATASKLTKDFPDE